GVAAAASGCARGGCLHRGARRAAAVAPGAAGTGVPRAAGEPRARSRGTRRRWPRPRTARRGRRECRGGSRDAVARSAARCPLRAARAGRCGRAVGRAHTGAQGAGGGAAREPASPAAGGAGSPGARHAASRRGTSAERRGAVRGRGTARRGGFLRGSRRGAAARRGPLVQPRRHAVSRRGGRQGDGRVDARRPVGAVWRRERRQHARGRRGARDPTPHGRLARGEASGWRARLGPRDGSAAAVTAKVAVLAPQVADQIAAGEVVERPASVVKELVENALDAGARAIRVEMEDGGKTLIRVSDDGEGMSRVDAKLALSRHATSKIRDVTDLIGVATFGFRGEALPAIASVARFELETSPDGRSGTRIRVVGGKCEAVEDAVRQHGTTVTVRALFFNTPARRKFLRAQATETRAAAEVLTLLALARPDVAFRLASDDRVLIDVPPAEQAI